MIKILVCLTFLPKNWKLFWYHSKPLYGNRMFMNKYQETPWFWPWSHPTPGYLCPLRLFHCSWAISFCRRRGLCARAHLIVWRLCRYSQGGRWVPPGGTHSQRAWSVSKAGLSLALLFLAYLCKWCGQNNYLFRCLVI